MFSRIVIDVRCAGAPRSGTGPVRVPSTSSSAVPRSRPSAVVNQAVTSTLPGCLRTHDRTGSVRVLPLTTIPSGGAGTVIARCAEAGSEPPTVRSQSANDGSTAGSMPSTDTASPLDAEVLTLATVRSTGYAGWLSGADSSSATGSEPCGPIVSRAVVGTSKAAVSALPACSVAR